MPLFSFLFTCGMIGKERKDRVKPMIRNCLGINATMVADEFIDRYMAGANGEYVKVYLYLLRHHGEEQDVGMIADALDHTESDVRRALGYWKKLGVLSEETEESLAGVKPGTAKTASEDVQGTAAGAAWNGGHRERPERAAGTVQETMPGEPWNAAFGEVSGRQADNSQGEQVKAISDSAQDGVSAGTAKARDVSGKAAFSGVKQGAGEGRRVYTPEQVSRLADQEDFTQLLYISQKYMNKVFTPRECEAFAYLYDALGMQVDVLEYLVEYCVQNGHSSIRYLESVALNWHEKGIRSVDAAKEYTSSFSKEGFAVMRAFGISDRRPGESEQKLIDKWFKEFGFTRDIVIEACSRTLTAIHKPSFSYTDRILTDWKKGGVRVLADVGKMDEKRGRESQKNGRGTGPVKPAKNQFHNFEQRGTNYDAMVLERLKERLGEQQG